MDTQPPANAPAETSTDLTTTGSPNEATAANATAFPPSPSPCTGLPEDNDESPIPPALPIADALPDLHTGSTLNDTGELAPVLIHPSLPTAGDGILDPNNAVRPLLATAGKNAFNFDSIREDFIDEAVIAYWEAVPGGGKWVEMVQSYLALSRLPPAKGVSSFYYSLHRK